MSKAYVSFAGEALEVNTIEEVSKVEAFGMPAIKVELEDGNKLQLVCASESDRDDRYEEFVFKVFAMKNI